MTGGRDADAVGRKNAFWLDISAANAAGVFHALYATTWGSILSTLLTVSLLFPAACAGHELRFLPVETQPIQSQTFTFVWTGGTPPFDLQVGVEDASDPLDFIDEITVWNYDWPVNIFAGESVVATVFDSMNNSATSPPFLVQPNSDSVCDPQAVACTSTSTSTTTIRTFSSTTMGDVRSASSTLQVNSSTSTSQVRSQPPSSTTGSSLSSATTSSPLSQSSRLTVAPQQSSSSVGGVSSVVASSAPTSSTLSPTPSSTSSSTSISSTSQPPPTVAPTQGHSTLSNGALTGIALGASVFFIASSFLLLFICLRRRRMRSKAAEQFHGSTSTDNGSQSLYERARAAEPSSDLSPAPSSYDLLRQEPLSPSGSSDSYAFGAHTEVDHSGSAYLFGGVLNGKPWRDTGGTDMFPPVEGKEARPEPESVQGRSSQPTVSSPEMAEAAPAVISRHASRADNTYGVAGGRGRSLRVSTDGGVRLAGGPPDALGHEGVLAGDDDVSETLTLPPPYQRY